MKTKVSDTSIINYHLHIEGAKERNEDTRVLNAIKHFNTATGRMISRYTGIENSNVARALNNLWDKNKVIEIDRKDYCPVTNKLVKFYRIKVNQLSIF